MTPDLDEKLRARFPKLLRKLRWGLECDDGWLSIIEETLQVLDSFEEPDLAVVQIKEKFGGLRIYLEGATEQHWDICEMAEIRSLETCEGCGGAGRIFRNFGWIYNRCGACERLLNLQK